MAKRDLVEMLTASFNHWDALYQYGGSDPFYADGTNLNLTRNHIIYHKREIEEQFADYPEIYHRETPPVVPMDYMAQPDRIRADAKIALEAYHADEDYQFLLKKVDILSPKVADKLCVHAVIGYAKRLEEAIKDDDLVAMRRHRHHERYLRSFRECAQEVRELKPTEGQLDIFDVLGEVTG